LSWVRRARAVWKGVPAVREVAGVMEDNDGRGPARRAMAVGPRRAPINLVRWPM